MEHQHESASKGALSDAETQLIALIAAIAIEQAIAETRQQLHIQQEGTAA